MRKESVFLQGNVLCNYSKSAKHILDIRITSVFECPGDSFQLYTRGLEYPFIYLNTFNYTLAIRLCGPHKTYTDIYIKHEIFQTLNKTFRSLETGLK